MQRAGKVYKALVYSGLLFIVAGIVANLLHNTSISRYISAAGCLFLLAGTCLIIFQPANHPRYYMKTGGISLTTASRLASILVLSGMIIRLLHWGDTKYIVNAGFAVYVVVLILSLVERKNASNSPSRIVDVMKLSESELETFTGIFINAHLGMQINITNTNNDLMAQATNQKAFPLTAVGAGCFEYNGPKTRIVIAFEADNNVFALKQRGGTFLFERQVAG